MTFDCLSDVLFFTSMENPNLSLTSTDIQSLENERLTSGMLEVAIHMLVGKNDKIHILTVYETKQFLSVENSPSDKMLINAALSHELIIAPWHSAGHYILIALNVLKNKFYVLDSLKQKSNKQAFFNMFKASMHTYSNFGCAAAKKVFDSDWDIVNMESDIQQDNFNCGIFTIHNAVQIAKI